MDNLVPIWEDLPSTVTLVLPAATGGRTE